ncbi:hypothetical protein Tamer19_13860 [Cupriavidus sp. TA19]|uniref:hypothetical protein n=1 Tax=unclassified Cupriavidus TaxID=2640874 RepID=UPI0027294774|nr:hypothetical protein [Cupriavidus sp. TA19]GLC91978.1 hypothetical protein Tamer19_13860 [Cupriavidus sp. TA19]
MQLASSLIAKVARIAPEEVSEMRSWIRANDADAVVPAQFAQGRQALAMALMKLEHDRPAQFWGGLLAFIIIPCLALHSLLR